MRNRTGLYGRNLLEGCFPDEKTYSELLFRFTPSVCRHRAALTSELRGLFISTCIFNCLVAYLAEARKSRLRAERHSVSVGLCLSPGTCAVAW